MALKGSIFWKFVFARQCFVNNNHTNFILKEDNGSVAESKSQRGRWTLSLHKAFSA